MMKCEIAQDLLTLYAEDLCSPETASELKKHLEGCETCSQKLKDYQQELTDKLAQTSEKIAKNTTELQPLKKVKKKLKRRKWLAIILGAIAIALIIGIGVLSYGQVTNQILSFSSIADIYKLNQVTKAYANGDSQALIDIYYLDMETHYKLRDLTDFKTAENYKAYLKEKLDEIYNKYLQGKKIKIKLTDFYAEPYSDIYYMDSPSSYYGYNFYDEGENLILSIDFVKLGTNKYAFSELEDYTNPFYKEFVSFLPPTNDIVPHILLQYASHLSYEDAINEATENRAIGIMPVGIRTYDPDLYPQDAENYEAKLTEKMTDVHAQNLCFTDEFHALDSFDTETGQWVIKVMFEMLNLDDNTPFVLECRFYSYDYYFYLMPDETAKIIGGETLTEEQTAALMTLFEY